MGLAESRSVDLHFITISKESRLEKQRTEWGIRSNMDAFLFAVFHEVELRQARVELNLVYSGNDIRF